MPKYFVHSSWDNGTSSGLELGTLDFDCGHPVVHVFTDDDLGRDGHVPSINDPDDRGWYYAAGYDEPTHVAIPIEQYRRIFGEL